MYHIISYRDQAYVGNVSPVIWNFLNKLKQKFIISVRKVAVHLGYGT
jgi:hypothetical protein